MLKKHEKTFFLLQIVTDALLIILSIAIAYYFRFILLPGGQEGLEVFFLKASFPFVFISLYFFHRYGLYLSYRFSKRSKEILAIIQANTVAATTGVLLLYFLAPNRVSRIMLLVYWVCSTLILTLARMIIRNILRSFRRKGRNLRHVLLIGDGEQLVDYVNMVNTFKDAGIKIQAWLESGDRSNGLGISNSSLSLVQARNQLNPDSIIIGFSASRGARIEEILKEMHNDVTPMQILPNLPYSFVGNSIEDFGGVPLIGVNQPQITTFDRALKRAFDFIASSLGLLLISPLMLLLSLGVKLSSKGPIFYGQKRMGLDGQEFMMWKFRSMKIDSDQDASGKMGWTTKDDPRKTKFGNILRKTSLDELPQVWNVVIGNMSLVGPRPEQPYWVDQFKDEIPMYMLRHKMKAGITGWAQVNGLRGDTSISKRIEFDIYYIKNWSFWFDIKILFLTFFKGFINRNAY